MYTMKADGVVFYDPSSNDMSRQVLSPKLKCELNKADWLTFVMLPDNVMYNGLHKLKTIITLEQDGEEIFRGRVLETTTDLYNQKEVCCEGELGYLLDSVQRPYEYDGSAKEYFSMLIANHNADVEEHKRFTVGLTTALTDEDTVQVESEDFRGTMAEIQGLLLNEFNGYLHIRYEGGIRYLDYVDKFENPVSNVILFGANLMDIENTVNVQDVCSVLVPVGKTSKGKFTSIKEANDGKDYIESATLIAKYGRIVKTYTFDDVEDPEELLELGQKHMEKMEAETTLTITAIDLGIAGSFLKNIKPGDTVSLVSEPNGLNKQDVCTKSVFPLEKPEKAEYTFGLPRETLTDSTASASRKSKSDYDKLKDWLKVTDTELTLAKQWVSETGDVISNVLFKMDAMNATILLKADQTVVSDLETRVSNAEILIDGANAAIDLKADRTIVTDLETRMSAAEVLIDGANAAIALKAAQQTVDELSDRLSQAEIDIDGANAQINLKASKTTVDALGERVSAAELLIDGQNSLIAAKADLILLEGYVKASELETEVVNVLEGANIYNLVVTSLSAYSVSGGSATFDNVSADWFTMGGSTVATEDWVEEQGYLTSAALSSYATQSWVNDQLSGLNSVYATRDWVLGTATAGLATEAWVRENFSKASATYKPTVIERYGSVSGNNIPVQALNEAGTVLLTGTVDAGDVYSSGVTNGKNSVTLSAAGWVGSTNVVSASNGKSVNVTLPTFSVSGGTSFNSSYQTTVYFSTPSVSGFLASKTVDASAVYQLGYTAGQESGGSGSYDEGYAAAKPVSVTVSKTYASAAIAYVLDIGVVSNDGTTSSFEKAFTAQDAYNAGYAAGQSAGGGGSGGTTNVTIISTTIGSDNVLTVYATDEDSGKILATKTFDLTSVYNRGWNACRDACTLANSVYTIKEYAPGTLYMKVTSGGQTYYSSVGSDWVRTTPATVYNRPAAKS